MRVLFVNSMRTFGGGERWLLEIAVGLAARAHTVALAARAGSDLAERARAAGIEVREFAMRSDFDPPTVVRLSRWIRRLSPGVVSVHVQRAVRLAAAAVPRSGPAVIERRGLLLPVKRSRLNRWVYGQRVKRVVANCQAIAESLVESGLVRSDRVSIIPNGIALDRTAVARDETARVRKEFAADPDTRLIAVVGRLVPDKGHRDALLAFSVLHRRVPTARLLVVGSGKLAGELRATVASMGLDRFVVFAGHRDDVPAVMSAADVVLVSSLREGMPHVVLEAMAAGVPIAATAVAGIPEMIRDRVEGLLVPASDPAAAAAAVERILNEPGLGERLAGNARDRVEREFALEAMIDRFEELFVSEAAGKDVKGSAAP